MPPQPLQDITRRQFVASAGIAATTAFFTPRSVSAGNVDGGVVSQMRKGAVKAVIKTQKVRENISVLIGSGGNIAVLHGEDGKLLVDAGITGSKPQITHALSEISSEPIKYLVNTHWHFDHTDGNEWLHGAGATVIAHENTRKRLAASTHVEAWDFTFPPARPGALPTIVFKKDSALHFNKSLITLEYYGPCHTDTDLCVTFPDIDVVHLGDTWWNGHYPFIDYSTGGSIDGMIRATQANLARVAKKTIIIPGHGSVGDKSQLTEYRDLLVDVRDKVAKLKGEGKSVNEAIAAKPTAKYDDQWGGFVIKPDTFVKLVFSGV